MTPAEKKASELWAQREHLNYPPATLDEIAEEEFKAGFMAALELEEVKGLEDAIKKTEAIVKLEAENKRLREAMQFAVDHLSSMDDYSIVNGAIHSLKEALSSEGEKL